MPSGVRSNVRLCAVSATASQRRWFVHATSYIIEEGRYVFQAPTIDDEIVTLGSTPVEGVVHLAEAELGKATLKPAWSFLVVRVLLQ